MKHLKYLLLPLLLMAIYGCFESSSDSIPVSQFDLHNYQFWAQGNLDSAESRIIANYTHAQTELDRIMAIENKTYNNFIRPYMDINANINALKGSYEYLNSVDGKPQYAKIVSTELSHNNDYSKHEAKYSKDIIKIAKDIYTKESESLHEEQRRVLLKMQFSKLPPITTEQEAVVAKLKAEIEQLGFEFEQNITESAAKYSVTVVDEKVLGDMSANIKAKYDNRAEGDSKALTAPSWTFAPNGEGYDIFMEYVSDRDLRRQMYQATKVPKNEELINKILQKRKELAAVYGLANYAEYRNKFDLSAESVQYVKDMLSSLINSVIPPKSNELLSVAEFALKTDGVSTLEPYDRAYYTRLYNESLTGYENTDKLFASYFEKKRTIKNIFTYMEKVYDIKIVEQPIPLWKGTAKKYFIYRNNDYFVGTLFVDFDSAPNKRGGAGVLSFLNKSLNQNGIMVQPVAGMFLNFTPDDGGKQITLDYDSIRTIMHELGHTMQHMLAIADAYLMSGLQAYDIDNGEYPSSFNEYLPLHSPHFLTEISKSVDNESKIDADFLNTYAETRKFNELNSVVTTAALSLGDIEIYSSAIDFASAQAAMDAVLGMRLIDITTHSHIFAGGYSAAYYTYIWGKMYAADSILHVQDLSSDTGFDKTKMTKYQTIMLMRASEGFPALYQEFRGAALDKDALLRFLRKKQ